MATLYNLAIAMAMAMAILRLAGHSGMAAACRHHSRDATWAVITLGLSLT